MVLTDSYGKERETAPSLLSDEDIEKYVEIGVNVCSDFDIDIDDTQNTISYSKNVTYPKTDFHDERTVTLSLTAYINPCDSDICKVDYFEEEKGIKKRIMGGKEWLRDSFLNEQYCPEIGQLMDILVENFDLRKKDENAYDKTVLSMIKTLPYSYEKLWNTYTALKETSKKCRYDRSNGTVIADGDVYYVRGESIILGDRVFNSVGEIEKEKTQKEKGTTISSR